MRLAERIARLEAQGASGAAAQHVRDLAAFDAQTARLSAAMPEGERGAACDGWAIGRAMLRHFPGAPLALVGCTMEDWSL